MPAMRVLRIGLLVAIVLAVSGCGAKKKSGSVPAGAEFAPASAVFYMVGVTDPDSGQWRNAEKLLNRFPGRGKLLAEVRKNLAWEGDIRPALPTEVHVVALDFESDNFVGYAKPKDEAKFNKLIESGDDPLVHRKIDGWTVFADATNKIDQFEAARKTASLADENAFTEAMAELPEDAALRGYVSGKSIQAELDKEAAEDPDLKSFQNLTKGFGSLESVSFSVAVEEDGVGVEAAYSSDPEVKLGSYSPGLDDALPAGALFYVSFGDLEDAFNDVLAAADKSFPEFKSQRSQIEEALGFSLKDELFPLFSQEGAVAIYEGRPIPGVVFMLAVDDEEKARNVVKRVAAIAELGGEATTRKFKVEGADATELQFPLEGFAVFMAVQDGKAVVTSTEKLLRASLGGGDKLSGDSVYEQARNASDAPDSNVGFLYTNLKDGLPWLFEISEEPIPGDVRKNIEPLQSAFFYAKKGGGRISLSGFLTIK